MRLSTTFPAQSRDRKGTGGASSRGLGPVLYRRGSVLVLLFAIVLSAQQQRDLRVERDTATAVAGVSVPRSYALVVGISQYKELPDRALQFADRDAESIYAILISPAGGNFRAENVHKLIGPRATLANLRRELEEWLPSVAKQEDRVLIYFAGHGFVFGGKAYLAPYDLLPKNIPGTGYPMETLGKVIGSRINARYKVLLTDACHSGAITPENQAINRSLLDLHTSLYSLTASRDRESSYESADWGGGHGIFTYYVVKGLEGEADQTADGIVTADELAEYVHRNVREATNARQNPTSERGSFDPNMPLAYIPKILSRRAASAPASDFGTLIFETNMDGVEVIVDGKSSGVIKKGTPLKLQGLRPGPHTIQGVKMGYEPDGPREEMVYPGQETTVSISIKFVQRRNKKAEDLLHKGLDYYNKGYAENYRKATEYFEQALALDPKFSQAALYLGRAYNALYEDEKSEKYFRRAIEMDPDYTEARASFGGMLLDIGSFDESIRQLNAVVPERYVKPPTGSRGDVQAAGLWNSGVWYVEIQRALSTGNADDAAFTLNTVSTFGMALMDNDGGDEHWTQGSALNKLGVGVTVDVKTTPAELPSQYVLAQNYPNPFNPMTTIRYETKSIGWVKLKVYNTLGQEVATLVDRTLGAGSHTAVFDARNLPTGVYIYRLTANNFTATKKMLLVR